MNSLLLIVMAISLGGLAFAWHLSRWVLRHGTGTPAMVKISDAIKAGAEAFLERQNRTIVWMALITASLMFVGYGFIRHHHDFDPVDTALKLSTWITVSFLLGAFCSVLAGYAGMWISIRTNIRTAHAAQTSLNSALQIALRGGAVSGLLVVSMSLLGVAGLYFLIHTLNGVEPERVPLLTVGYGFGASFVALFAQLGGGIYTKAADVGADLVGKVEAGIPEDDPRNPAVIADLVGDNVGDCAGRGADLFESTAAENIGAMIIGATLASTALRNGMKFSHGIIGVIMFPLLLRAFGIIASICGIMSVKLKDEEKQDPMSALNNGFVITVLLSIVALGGATYYLLNSPDAPNAWWHLFLCGLLGILASLALVYITQYYTEDRYRPVKSVVDASETGPATNVIAGLAVGLESTALPVLVMASALLGSYYLGKTCGLPNAGLFGTAVATMGMLISAAYVLAMDTFGPITDNAGGIVEMAKLHEDVRVRTDRLDAVGNTTKALTKGYAIGSAGLAAFLLFQAYIDEVIQYAGLAVDAAFPVDLSRPVIFVGGLLGAMLVFFFTALTLRAVGRAAQSVIGEVRRQFADLRREDDMIHFTKDFEPDYRTCVDIVTTAALKEMVLPGLLVVLAPLTVGVLFRAFIVKGDELIAAQTVAAMLMVGTIAGILMALFLNNSGGAWDNAKKSVECRKVNGKYIIGHDGKRRKNPTHGAAVVGDTVGDPFKDTAGPSLHVLIKLLATLALVLAPLFL